MTGFSRSTQRYVSVRGDRDRALTAAIYQVVSKHPRYGYRMVTAKLQAAGWRVNANRLALAKQYFRFKELTIDLF